MADYFDEHGMTTAEVQKALAALPAEVRGYLVDLITLTLGETPDMDECWSDEWRSVRTILGGPNQASLEEEDPRMRINHA